MNWTGGSLNTSGLITFCLTSDCLTPALQSVCHPLSLPATPTITACPSPTSPPATQHSAQLQRRSTLWLWNKPNMAAAPPTLSNNQINLIEADVLSITALCMHGNIAHGSDLYFHSYCPVGSGSFAHIDIIFTAIALLAAYLSHPSPPPSFYPLLHRIVYPLLLQQQWTRRQWIRQLQ